MCKKRVRRERRFSGVGEESSCLWLLKEPKGKRLVGRCISQGGGVRLGGLGVKASLELGLETETTPRSWGARSMLGRD